MVSGGEGEFGSKVGVKRFPKVAGKTRIAIRDDGLRDTMEFDDVGEKE